MAITGYAYSADAGRGFRVMVLGEERLRNHQRALVPLGEWLYYNGTSRVVAGYTLVGNAGRVGATYNVNILRLGAEAGQAQGFFALVNALRAEAVASGASRISITGEWIANKALIPFFTRVAGRFGLQLEVLTSAEGTAVTLSGAL